MPIDRSQNRIENQEILSEDLSYDKFNEMRFEDCIFTGCNFTETTFSRCTFHGCTFRDCNLSLVKVRGCTFSNTRFEDSFLPGVDWSEITSPKAKLYCPVAFINCVLDYASFFGLDLKNTQIHKCKAKHADFREANLTGANLTYTEFDEAEFKNTNLTAADFRDAKNYSIDIRKNETKNAQFSMPEAMSLLYLLDIQIS